MYGLPIQKQINNIRKHKNLLIIVGSSKVPIHYYKLSNFNISITTQPHSEVSSLVIFLHEYFKGKELNTTFKNAKLKIVPQEQGLLVQPLCGGSLVSRIRRCFSLFSFLPLAWSFSSFSFSLVLPCGNASFFLL